VAPGSPRRRCAAPRNDGAAPFGPTTNAISAVDFFLNSLIVPAQKGRFKAIGRLGLQVVIVFAPLGTEAISVVSMRFAGKRERSLFDDR